MGSLKTITFFLVVLVSVIIQDGLADFPRGFRFGRRLNLNQAEPETDDYDGSKVGRGSPSIEPLSPEQFPTSIKRAHEDPTLPPDLLDVPLATSTSKPSLRTTEGSSRLPDDDGLPADDPIEPEDMPSKSQEPSSPDGGGGDTLLPPRRYLYPEISRQPSAEKSRLEDVPRDPILLSKIRSAHRGILDYNRSGYYGRRRGYSSGFRNANSEMYADGW